MFETEDYMLDMKDQIRNLEAERRKPTTSVIPPLLFNPVDASKDEPPMNNSNSANIAYHSKNTSSNKTNRTSGKHVSDIAINSSQFSQFQKLSKLTIPIFTVNILEWQTFLDSFKSSVHTKCILIRLAQICASQIFTP